VKGTRTTRQLTIALLLLVVALVCAACGDSATSSASSTAVQPDAMTVSQETVLTPVVGTFSLAEERYTTGGTVVGDIRQIRAEDWVLRYEMSDPRVSGERDTIINVDQRADGSAEVWGTAVLRNEQGTWECSKWTVTIAKGGLEHYGWLVYAGTGAYAGLTFYEQVHFVEAPGISRPPEEGVAVTGWIQASQ
jgi:hypothetical protein